MGIKRLLLIFLIYSTIYTKNPSFSNKKALQQKAKGLEMSWLPRQDDFRNFCMSDETEKVCHKLEEVVGIC